MATSLGGVLMGRGADAIFVDDPLKPDDALSLAVRTHTNAWYLNSLLSRLNSQVTGQILLVMQRLHEDDLAGFLQAQGGFEVLSLPAIAECDEVHHIVRPTGTITRIRREGEALHPELLPIEKLRDTQQRIGAYNFAGQYQQRPAPLGGGMVNTEWFPRYGQSERPEKFDLVLQSWDCANKVSAEASYSVCITFGVTREKIYVLHVLRKRLEFPDLKRAVRTQAKAHAASVVLIEDKAAGTQLIQELRHEGLDCAKGAEPTTDKRSRMLAQTPAIENGRVWLPREAHWLGDFLAELALFHGGKHDDQVDALSQGLKWIADNGIEPGIITFYKNELKEALEKQNFRGTRAY